jgi:serine/threonine-protein kinase
LSDELLSEQIKRLAVLSAVGIGLWSFGLLQDQVLVPLVGVRDMPSVNYFVSLAGIVISAAMLAYVRFAPHDPTRKMDVGLGFMLVNAFLVALLNSWVVVPTESSLMRLSWVGVIILIYPMIVAVSPRKMFAAALAAAAMDPLCVWLANLRGLPVPSVAGTLVLYLPNFVLALVAVVPTQLVNKLRRSLHEAQRLGSYELVERLGEGGMGEVWRARHRLLAREAAVKLVRPEVLGVSDGDSRVALRRFEREARATASLNSPHTIGVFDFGLSNEGLFYYVMELLAGMDLETLVRQFGPLPPERAVFLLRQVSHSLADAHARGMVHRDIKPANIYVCRMGLDYDFIKVLDFGLVKLRSRPEQVVIGQTLAALDHGTTGTPAYMAPEIILGEHDVDRRADVYALGCVAYYLLTGQLVFDAETPMKMLMHHVQSRPLPPSQRTELPIPPELDELVLACLEKDPARRPPDAGALFRMAVECRTCSSWDQTAARTWWETHLPELTGPLTLGEPDTGMVERVALLPH